VNIVRLCDVKHHNIKNNMDYEIINLMIMYTIAYSMNIYQAVYDLVSQIPSGKVSTYGGIAKALGDVRASRAVGRILNSNPKLIDIPCHRVVHSNSDVGGYRLGIKKKIELLEDEGIGVRDWKVEAFSSHLFSDFVTDYPLKKLRDEQIAMGKKVVLDDAFEKIETVAGVDAAYSGGNAYGTCVVFDYSTKKIIDEKTVVSKIDFPYISTYLSFREYPVIEKTVKSLSEKPTVLMFDGNGVLHPFGIGIASHAGVLLDIPTIGVAKNLLCGTLEFIPKKQGDFSRVVYKNKTIGFCLKSSKNAKPVFISPGHKISFESSLKIVKEFCKYRIPEPIRIADMIGKRKREVIKTLPLFP